MSKLTDLEIERVAFLFEECSEVIKCAGKALRFGKDAEYFKEESFEAEIADVLYAVKLMSINGDLDVAKIKEAYAKRVERMKGNVWLSKEQIRAEGDTFEL